jgi:GT2 family glycosyltransferase
VNYNGGALLVDCVQSVLASSIPIELIISDNGSTDGSMNLLRAALKEDRRLKIVENGRNLGFAGASNAALAHAHGQYILFLNPDCLIHPDTLQIMCDEMDARPNAAVAGCVIRNPDGSEQAGCRRRMPALWSGFGRAFALDHLFKCFRAYAAVDMRDEPLPEGAIEVEAISGAFMFVRRSALEAVGPLDEGYFLHCEDLDWCMRFRQGGFKVFFVPSTDITHFKGVSSAARPVSVEWHKHRGMLRFYRKFLFDRYPRLVVLLVSSGVWLHFCFVAMRRSIRRLL